jgi:hypothetical protein
LALLTTLMRWHPARRARALPPERLHDAVFTGIRYVAMSPAIRVALLRALLFGFASVAIQALLPLVARDLLHGGALTYGLLLGSFGAGAVTAAFGIRALRRRLSTEHLLRLCAVFSGVGAAGVAFSRTGWMTAPSLALAGAGWLLTFSTLNVSVQLMSPRWVTARSLSLYQMACYGGMALGSWAVGLLANHQGVVVALFCCAGLNVCTLISAHFFPVATPGGDDLDSMNDWRVPELAVPIHDHSGPIVIVIEHRIAQDNAARFATAMRERRRICLRDGARKWSLQRDLADAELWIERYQFPTWLEYVRRNSRRTHADEANRAALRELRIHQAEPVVRRMIERPVG